jgi:acyl carrier protein
MVPAAFVRLDAMPLTPNGKVDRKALPAPAHADGGRRLRPATALEERIAAIWRELLARDEVGVDEHFFDLGGHSLLLVRLRARLAHDLGRELAVVELLEHPTVRALAARLQGTADSGATGEGAERGGARQAALGQRLAARRLRGG